MFLLGLLIIFRSKYMVSYGVFFQCSFLFHFSLFCSENLKHHGAGRLRMLLLGYLEKAAAPGALFIVSISGLLGTLCPAQHQFLIVSAGSTPRVFDASRFLAGFRFGVYSRPLLLC